MILEFPEEIADPAWRLQNLYWITDKNGNKVPFQANNVQKKINDSVAKRKMILKARQFGVSTNELIKLLDWTMFNENATSCIIAHEQDAIRKLFSIVRKAYRFLPDYLKPELDRGGGSQYEMFFPAINSKIYCDLEVRGDTVGRLHVSEAAFMKDSSRLKATLQAVPIETGRVTIETTANGMANYFYDMWSDPDSIYEKLFFPWYIFPEYQIAIDKPLTLTDEEIELMAKAKHLYNVSLTHEQIQYRRFKKSEMKQSSFDKRVVSFEQEYPEDDKTCFLSSGEAAIDLMAVNDMMSSVIDPIRTVNGIKIYREFNKLKQYIVGADPSEGINKDSSAAVMLDASTLETVAVFNGSLKPSLFAAKLVEMCEMYSQPGRYPPLLVVERNNHGHAVLLSLNEILSYSNIFIHEQSLNGDDKEGFRTTSLTRPLVINSFIDAVENKELKILDRQLLNECLTLINNNGKIEAATGKHDDLIMACAIALFVRPSQSFSNYDDIESRIKL